MEFLSARRTVFGNLLIYRVNSGKRDVGGIPARLVDFSNRVWWTFRAGLLRQG
jgi:hypothetical protein